mgnify:CR=1 FL=1
MALAPSLRCSALLFGFPEPIKEPIPLTAFAFTTNSPSLNMAGMSSDLSVPGPDICPFFLGKFVDPPSAKLRLSRPLK